MSFLIGILIGTAMVVPGVSGGVIAVIFGIYDKAINSFVNLFKDFKHNFIYLFKIGFGILIGAIWFSNILLFLYKWNTTITKLTFIGLILGGVPSLLSEVKKRYDRVNYLVIIIVFIISLFMFCLSKLNITNMQNNSFFNMFIGGLLYSVGKAVPGISGSFLLMMVGMYDFVLSLIAHPITVALTNIDKVIPFLLGLIIGVIILVNIMNKLLINHVGMTYSIIIGFILGSIPALIPNGISILSVLFMLSGFILSYLLTKSK